MFIPFNPLKLVLNLVFRPGGCVGSEMLPHRFQVLSRVSFRLYSQQYCSPFYLSSSEVYTTCEICPIPLLMVHESGLAWYENIPRWSLLSMSVYKRYYLFLVMQVFRIISTDRQKLTVFCQTWFPCRYAQFRSCLDGSCGKQMVLLVPSYMLNTISQLINNPTEVVTEIASRLPNAAIFFLTWTCMPFRVLYS